jgi:hypothetical protein
VGPPTNVDSRRIDRKPASKIDAVTAELPCPEFVAVRVVLAQEKILATRTFLARQCALGIAVDLKRVIRFANPNSTGIVQKRRPELIGPDKGRSLLRRQNTGASATQHEDENDRLAAKHL